MPSADLSTLSRGVPAPIALAPPRSRWGTRVLVPGAIVLATVGLLGYAGRETLRPAVSVHVAPVIVRAGTPTGASASSPAEIIQAPGWIEADPYAISVPALQAGVVRDVLALEGQTVKPGDVVATLVDEDAKLAERRAAAALERAEAALSQSRASLQTEEARRSEMEEELKRKEAAFAGRAVSEFETISARLRLQAQVATVEASRSAIQTAEADVGAARAALDEAKLAVERTQIRATSGGVVLSRLIEPGQRLMPDANNPFAGVVIRLYDPAKLQVRVDVPLADAAKVAIGDPAEIVTEAMANRTFHGRITRLVQQGDIQKNTLQVKVAITDPTAELRPEMLVRARIAAEARAKAAGTPGASSAGASSDGAILVPRAALHDASAEHATVWVLDVPTSTATPRHAMLGRATGPNDTVEVTEGLRPGDRVILDLPANVKPGAKVAPIESGGNP